VHTYSICTYISPASSERTWRSALKKTREELIIFQLTGIALTVIAYFFCCFISWLM